MNKNIPSKNTYLERASYNWSRDSIRLINTPSASARRSFFYVQEAGYFKTSPPYFTERQNLNSWLLVYTISGHGSLNYQGETYSLQAGQLFFIHCMDWHHYECPKAATDWEFLWLHFAGPSAPGYYEEFAASASPVVTFDDTFFIESNLRRILSLTQKKDVHSELICADLITNILTQILILGTNENLAISVMPTLIKDVLKYMDQNFRGVLSLDTLALQFHISKFYLSREFKKYVGTTINEYIITARINYAKELLKYSSDSVQEIAQSCGWINNSHFINLFKAREGMTPLQYRKAWMGNV